MDITYDTMSETRNMTYGRNCVKQIENGISIMHENHHFTQYDTFESRTDK